MTTSQLSLPGIIQRGTLRESLERGTLYEAFSWFLGIHSRRCAPATLLMHRANARYLKAWWEDCPLPEVTYERIWTWINDQVGGGLRMNTVIKRLCTLRQAMQEARRADRASPSRPTSGTRRTHRWSSASTRGPPRA